MRYVRSIRLTTACLALGLLSHRSLTAQDQRIFQMVHTAWTVRDGAPQNINNLAQTPDGTLWLGTRDGLYSFDGIKFSAFQPVSGSVARKNVQHLFVAKDRSLWLFGDFNTPPIRIRDGTASAFGRLDQGTFGTFDHLQQSGDGTLWGVLDARELLRLGANGIWHVVKVPKHYPGLITCFFIDSSDTQWLVIDEMLYRRFRGEENFTPTRIPVYGARRLVEGQDHGIWIISSGPTKPVALPGQPPVVGFMHVDQFGNRLPNPVAHGNDITNLVIGTDGSVWVSHTQSGLQRLRPWEIKGRPLKGDADPSDLYDVSDGLTTTGYRQLLRDRDGNIWVAGGRGLDRFQRAIMVPVVKNGISGWWSVCAAPNGEVWLAVLDGFFAVARGDRLARLEDHFGISSILCGEDGRVRLLDQDGVAEVSNERIVQLPLLPGRGRYMENYEFASIAILPDHRLIASAIGITTNPLWIFDNRTWKPFLPSASIGNVRAMMLGRDNRLYLGSESGQITVLRVPSFKVQFSVRSAIGAVEGFSETTYGTFAFGDNGVALERNGSFQMLSFSNPILATSVTGLVKDRDGNIWINGSHAIARVASEEIATAVSEPSHHLAAREFHEGDFKGSDIVRYSRNSAQIDVWGRLWFATANGVIYIDPKHIDRFSHPPSLTIRSITADGRTLSADGRFPPRIDLLNVHYFGLNLSDPTSVVYQYKLDGYDTSWQSAGTRTEAVYTHLQPGKYDFEVEASNGDGVWTSPLESAPFRILPAFYQTVWFELLCALMTALMIWFGLAMRVRYVAAQIKLRIEERAEERVRIARELHDTLLQGVQGLLLSFHAAASKVSPDHESKEALNRALITADRIILEGRDRVNRLRSEHFKNGQLEPSIRDLAGDLTAGSDIHFAMKTKGTQQPLDPEVEDEVYFIAREALTNSFRHSGGSQVVVALDFEKDKFTLECKDDGRGLSDQELFETNGHWGLRGMSERAQRIGADFKINSVLGEGVRVSIVVPAAQAYIRNHRFRFLFQRRTVL
jgi:signal transduction histidine kinase/ligand-binding sensor domain-containing protein